VVLFFIFVFFSRKFFPFMGDNTNEIEFVKFIDRLNLSIVEFGEDKIEV